MFPLHIIPSQFYYSIQCLKTHKQIPKMLNQFQRNVYRSMTTSSYMTLMPKNIHLIYSYPIITSVGHSDVAAWSYSVLVLSPLWPLYLLTSDPAPWLCPVAGLTLALQPAVSLGLSAVGEKPSEKRFSPPRNLISTFQLVPDILLHCATHTLHCWRLRDQSEWHR